mmetsp:Transcript_104540/g.320206  ORF Transcript_104540/g.320206 Transcript_104540/m.320206 type:complete len:420 (-) Transcript_104540:23-1282(-)
MLALEIHHVAGEPAALVHGVHHAGSVLVDDAEGAAHPVIVLAEGGRLVDDARARLVRDVRVRDDVPDLVQSALGLDLGAEVREQRLVGEAFQCRAFDLLQKIEVLLGVLLDGRADPLEAVLANDPLGIVAKLLLQTQVRHLGVDAQRQVRRQGPGRRRPRQDVRVVLAFQLELHDDGGVRDLLVILRRLEVGQRRAQGGAIGHDAEGSVHQSLLEQLLEDPPDRLHETQVHGFVIVVEIHPTTETLHDLAPLLHVHLDDGPALLVVLVDAKTEHVGAAGDLELGIDDLLHWHAVAIPTESPLDVPAALVGVPADDILDRAGEDVPVVRQPGRKGRAVVEIVRGPPFGLLDGFLERVDLPPIRNHLLLLLREAGLVGDLVERGLRRHPSNRPRAHGACGTRTGPGGRDARPESPSEALGP